VEKLQLVNRGVTVLEQEINGKAKERTIGVICVE
jgi:hypothetical protein